VDDGGVFCARADETRPVVALTQADELVADCGRRGVAVSEMAAEEGAGPVGRLGSLIGLLDFTAVYVGLASGAPVLGGPDPDGEDDL